MVKLLSPERQNVSSERRADELSFVLQLTFQKGTIGQATLQGETISAPKSSQRNRTWNRGARMRHGAGQQIPVRLSTDRAYTGVSVCGSPRHRVKAASG